jgi:asparagine synthase (glutamine-hydrolysing)
MSLERVNVENFAALCEELVKRLKESVGRNVADGILLSGGLDTSILAYLISQRAKPKAVTIAFRNAPAPDIWYARFMASLLGLEHVIHHFDEKELNEALPTVVKATDSFDPMEIRNSVTVFIGLKCAKENGVNKVMVGDGCDELFAGYGFLLGFRAEELNFELRKIWSTMSFSSIRLAEALNVEVKLPYLDPRFKKFAMGLPPYLKVQKEKGKVWGKWILRKAFENLLPQEIVWRVKTPIEHGSGTSILPRYFDSIIHGAEFEEKKSKYLTEDGVTLRDKEQLFYYEIYRSKVGVPHPSKPEGKICPYCNSSIANDIKYCRRCGGYSI